MESVMRNLRSILSSCTVLALALAAPSAHATSLKYTFNSNVTINPDSGRFWSPGDTDAGHLQGTMQLQFSYDSTTNTGSLTTDPTQTYLGFGNNCTSSNNGSGCTKYVVDTGHSTSVTFDGAWYTITFKFIKSDGSGVIYSASLLLGTATYLGAGGASVGGFYRSDSQNSAWMGSLGKLCQATSCP
jgi:hypothetical protein